MSSTIYPLRLSDEERRELGRAAKSAGQTLAEFLREAAKTRARQFQHRRRAAILSYPEVELPLEAEQSPKEFIRKKLEAKRELYR